MQRTGSILVVDNEPSIVDMIVDVLTGEGYVAYSAPDGACALAAIALHPPALLLLDVRMPVMSGTKLIAQLHNTGLASMPIVLIPASPSDAAPLLVPGSIECLPKPFDIDDLLTCVARHVRPARAADQLLALQIGAETFGMADSSGVAPLWQRRRQIGERL